MIPSLLINNLIARKIEEAELSNLFFEPHKSAAYFQLVDIK